MERSSELVANKAEHKLQISKITDQLNYASGTHGSRHVEADRHIFILPLEFQHFKIHLLTLNKIKPWTAAALYMDHGP